MKVMKAMKTTKPMKVMKVTPAMKVMKVAAGAAKLQLGCKSCRGAPAGCKTCRQPSFSGWRGDREAWEALGLS